MNERTFGRRSPTATSPEALYHRRNRLFPQIATYQFSGISAILSIAVMYGFRFPTGPQLGLVIIGIHLAMFFFFAIRGWNVLIVDEKFESQATASTSKIGPLVGLSTLWLLAALFGLMLLANQSLQVVLGCTLVMSILLFATVLRRNILVVQRSDRLSERP